jgi:hypothetical protein
MIYTESYINSLTDDFDDHERDTWRVCGDDELFKAMIELGDHSKLTENINAAYHNLRYRPDSEITYIVRGVFQLDCGDAFMICVRDPNRSIFGGSDPDQFLEFLNFNFNDLYEIYYLEDLGNRVVVYNTGCECVDFIPIG